MEEDHKGESEFQQLSVRQKEVFIRKKLAEFDSTYSSERALKELSVRFLHPEILTWEGSGKPVRMPPQQGIIMAISADTAWGRKRIKFVNVDLTGTSHITGIEPYAQFGLGAVEVTKGGGIVVDCTKLESPKGIGRAMFPQNTFLIKGLALEKPTLVRR